MNQPLDWLVPPARRFEGELRVPGDKSISHRAVMLGSIAAGPDRSDRLPRGRGSPRHAARGSRPRNRRRFGRRGVAPDPRGGTGRAQASDRSSRPREFGNRPSPSRGSPRRPALRLDPRRGRIAFAAPPWRRIAERCPGWEPGSRRRPGGTPPLALRGGRRLAGIDHRLGGAERAGEVLPVARGTVRQRPHPDRGGGSHAGSHGADAGPVSDTRWSESRGEVAVAGGGELMGQTVAVPGDLSSAPTFWSGPVLRRGGRVRIPGVASTPPATGCCGSSNAWGRR